MLIFSIKIEDKLNYNFFKKKQIVKFKIGPEFDI